MNNPSHLESLPMELIHQINSHLLIEHKPDRSVLLAAKETPSPLLNLAATSRTLRSAVESYCRTLLLRWSCITKFSGELQNRGKVPKSHRGLLLRWKNRHCVFCGKKSQRKAILCTGFGCCKTCDKKEWPDKITKTNAKKEYHLTEEELFPDKSRGLPMINYGSYTVEGGIATMFLRRDVEVLANAVHGNWKKHMQERWAKSEARIKKMAEKN